jgi:hypothetical protein
MNKTEGREHAIGLQPQPFLASREKPRVAAGSKLVNGGRRPRFEIRCVRDRVGEDGCVGENPRLPGIHDS